MEAPTRDTVVIDGKTIKITKLPPAPVDADLNFDRWQHDSAHISPDVSRGDALALKGNWQSGDRIQLMGKNGRVRPKRQQ